MQPTPNDVMTWLLCFSAVILTVEKVMACVINWRILVGKAETPRASQDEVHQLSVQVARLEQIVLNLQEMIRELHEVRSRR